MKIGPCSLSGTWGWGNKLASHTKFCLAGICFAQPVGFWETCTDLVTLYIRKSEKWEEIYDSHCTENSSLERGYKQEELLSHYYLKLERQPAHGCSRKVPDNVMFSVSPETGVTDSVFYPSTLCSSSVANEPRLFPPSMQKSLPNNFTQDFTPVGFGNKSRKLKDQKVWESGGGYESRLHFFP